MKFFLKNRTPIIVSYTLCRIIGKLVLGQTAMGVAIFPVILVRDIETLHNENLIRHETIHLRQYVETLFIGMLFIGIVQNLYARFILRKNSLDAYYYTSHEQEAHQNDEDPDYLKNRKWFSYYKYLLPKNKVKITYINGKRTVYKDINYFG